MKALLSSLTNRIFLASAFLAAFSIGSAVYIVSVRVTNQAEGELERGLEEAGRLLDHQRQTLSEDQRRMARLMADLPRLKAAVDLADPPTVRPLAEEYRSEVNSDLLLVTDRAGRVLAWVGETDNGGPADSRSAILAALAGKGTTAFWATPRGILQVVSVPILGEPSEILGTLSMGFALDEGLAEQLKALTESEISFGYEGRILAGTLPRASLDHLAAYLSSQGMSRLWLGPEEYVALARPLSRGEGLKGPVALILRSRTQRLRFLGSLHRAMGLTALAALALATLLSYAVARTVTRPIRALTSTMGEMAATGDLKRPLPLPSPWQDEDARVLTRTFGSMTEALARFQKEASQRERLASLGRLSTVIAHEIRNPLMIIKSAVRTLRHGAPAEAVEALVDIDGEVARLNRLVNDVLDFARPIRYELSPSDINGVCQRAAAAALAGGATSEGVLDLDPELKTLVTDGERLHSALVNILTNARQALEARGDRRQGPGLTLSTRRTAQGGVMIRVEDRGIGISREDLGRVAEPYFTTKRGGTGLGLAIAKNVIEGLGGSLSVESRVGEGTEVRLELPPTT